MLDLGRPQIHDSRFIVRFELDPLQLEAIHIDWGEIAGLQPLAIDFKLVVPVSQVLLGVLEERFRLQDVDESAAQVEQQVALLVQIGRFRDGGDFLWPGRAATPACARVRAGN